MSVDLPAPFSPTIAWMVPRRTVRLTSELATTPGNRLVIPLSSTAGGSVSITAPLQHADNGGEPKGSPPSLGRSGGRLRRNRDLAVDDLLLVVVELALD